MSEIRYEDLPDGVVRVILEIDAQALLDVHEDVAWILVRDLLRNALVQRQQGLRRERPPIPDEITAYSPDMFDALLMYSEDEQRARATDLALLREQQVAQARAIDQQNRENQVRFYEEMRRVMAEATPERGAWSFGFDSSARGCESHIFTDPACAACTAIQARRKTKPHKLNPKHPLNALDGERE